MHEKCENLVVNDDDEKGYQKRNLFRARRKRIQFFMRFK